MSFNFRDTSIYIKAVEYDKFIKDLIKKEKPEGYIVNQMKRASGSIVLNLAEGYGRFHRADKKNFYINARASVNECVACADMIYGMKLPEVFLNKSEELAKMISGLINKFKE